MKHKVKIVVAVLAILIAGTAFAQDKRKLGFNEAIDLSIKNSKQLKGSIAKIEEATASLKEAVDRKLPDASVAGSYLRLNKPNINLKAKPGNNTGGSATSANATPKPSSAAYSIATVSLPLFSGFKIKYGIQSAKYLEEAAKLDADNDREEIILNTINAYTNLYKSRAAVDLVNESLQTANQRVKQFSDLEKNGLLARNELLKAQLQASNMELALLDAQNNWQLANINMNLMIGLPENTELIVDSSVAQPAASLKSIDEYVQSALQNRKDLSALSYRKKAASVNIKATEGEKYPGLALTAGYIALGIPQVLTVTNAVNVGIGVNYSISSLWKNKAKVQQAQAREKQVVANEEVLADVIRLEVNQAYHAYLLSQKKIEVLAKAIDQATENYGVVKNKYENSLATTTELLDADVAQLQAKMNYTFSKADANAAYDKLLQAAGLLTQQLLGNK